jgi:hypothetical protein
MHMSASLVDSAIIKIAVRSEQMITDIHGKSWSHSGGDGMDGDAGEAGKI